MKKIKKRKGWRNERMRHSLARKGFKTGRKKKRKKKPAWIKSWERASADMNKQVSELYAEADKYT